MIVKVTSKVWYTMIQKLKQQQQMSYSLIYVINLSRAWSDYLLGMNGGKIQPEELWANVSKNKGHDLKDKFLCSGVS